MPLLADGSAVSSAMLAIRIAAEENTRAVCHDCARFQSDCGAMSEDMLTLLMQCSSPFPLKPATSAQCR